MSKICEWCGGNRIVDSEQTVYWELPDGTRAVEIENTPSIRCLDCTMEYQEEALIKEIEDQLFLINTKLLPKSITHAELMQQPRILKRNYFDFSDL
ncbi:YokU family protein [Caldibacillus lycopersici]|uniref:YokU family protein n=1 Tax=Perspicuibacillus lycopersici TaxID=1325689 RepID=A0AAE3IVF7_9BACI|nr:YokU family protein [Perspicuibacillus lycopersici]MCU9613619.1 YokU family protein [Perspicuibacillus lycopersici]